MKNVAIGAFFILIVLALIEVLQTPKGTTPVWIAQYDREIPTVPRRVGNKVLVLGDSQEIALLDLKGNVITRQRLPRAPRHPLVALPPSLVVVADNEAGLRAYSTEDLSLRWERATIRTSPVPPIALPGNRLLVRTDERTLIAVDGDSGDPIWDIQLPVPVQCEVVGEKALACIFGDDKLPQPTFRLQSYDMEDGQLLWSYPAAVAQFAPVACQDLFFFATAEGSVIGADQQTGEPHFRFDSPGLHNFFAEGDILLVVASDGRQVNGFTLTNRKTWTTRLQASFLTAKALDNLIMIADRAALQCIDVSKGSLVWQRKIGPILLAYPHRQGMAVLYKTSFIDRYSYFAYFPASSGEPLWVCIANSMFHPPLPDGKIDFVVCRNGALFGMPVPSATVESTTFEQIPLTIVPKAKDNTQKLRPKVASSVINPDFNFRQPNFGVPTEPIFIGSQPHYIPDVSEHDSGWE